MIRSGLTRAAPDPRLRRSVVSRPFTFVRGLVQSGSRVSPARAGELRRWVAIRKRKKFGEAKSMKAITQNKAGKIGVRSALVGSLLFAIVGGITLKSGEVSIIEKLINNFPFVMSVFCISIIFSVFPGYLGGRILEKLSAARNFNKLSVMTIGAILGVVAVALISLLNLYVVLSAHNYWSINNNPAFPVYINRLMQASIIAALMGGWSGFLIAKVTQPNTACTGRGFRRDKPAFSGEKQVPFWWLVLSRAGNASR